MGDAEMDTGFDSLETLHDLVEEAQANGDIVKAGALCYLAR